MWRWKQTGYNHYFKVMKTSSSQQFFNYRHCIERISKLTQRQKCRPFFNVEASMLYQIWLHNAVTNIQPYFNVDKTLCAG